jgi:hypothetical protein
MQVIVPLAGPDFVSDDGSIKAMTLVHDKPILKYALDSRPWAPHISRYIFIFHDCDHSRSFVAEYLRLWFKNSSVLYLSDYTRGSVLTALSGISVIQNYHEPLIIDLADILYDANIDIRDFFRNRPECGGIALTFNSASPHYSYLACDRFGAFVEAAEKRVISGQASAGSYVFQNSLVFLKATIHAIEHESSQAYQGQFYICPLFNGVLKQRKAVALHPVTNVLDIKFFAH